MFLSASPGVSSGYAQPIPENTDSIGEMTPVPVFHDQTNGDPDVSHSPAHTPKTEPSFTLADNVTEAMYREADTVRESLEKTASRFFTPEPLGFSPQTFVDLYQDVVTLPLKLPRLMNYIVEQARLLGFIGTMIILLFLSALTYMLTGQRNVLKYLENQFLPLIATVPESMHPYLKLILKLSSAVLLPGIFWIVYWIVQSFTGFDQPWFLLIGRLMVVWAGAVAILVVLRELFINRLIRIPETYGKTIYRVTRYISLYIVFTVIIFYGAEAFQINPEYLALLRVVIYLSVVFVSIALLVKRQAIMSLLPDLPYRGYQVFRITLNRVYVPAMIGTFLTGILWSFGYRELCRYIWTKTWAVAMVIIIIMLLYHFSSRWIVKKRHKYRKTDESAEKYYASLSSALIIITAILLFYFVFSLLGIYNPLKRLISFPIFYAGETPVSIWTGLRAILIVLIALEISKILRSYMDFRIFNVLGVEEGLAYSINTFIGYVLIVFSALFALHTTGMDLRILLVFAGAIGIGIGFGLQNFAANVISGFALIFGRRVRKGDWIETAQTKGYVKEVTLRATKMVTRDNIEYIIPNTELTSKTIINYTLTEPLIRLHVPVGVSYKADPEKVKSLLLQEAAGYDKISGERHPAVILTGYGDSSIDFKLLVWIDIRKNSELIVRSDLYFKIFKAFAQAGIEIPYPQRDIHIRTDITKES